MRVFGSWVRLGTGRGGRRRQGVIARPFVSRCFVCVRFVALIISSIATETLTAGPGRTRSVGHIFHAIAHLIKACAKGGIFN